jgi:hypothetical protein
MPLPEFGDHLDPEPEDISRIMELLPARCRGCKYIQSMIGILLVFESSTGGPWPIIEEVDVQCTGYEGEAEHYDIQSITLPSGTSCGLLFPFIDEDRCPYKRQLDEYYPSSLE